jgi:UDP-glucose 4-epimerase
VNKKNILVTGAGGLIGSNITRYLANKNYNVFALYQKKPEIVNPFNWKCLSADLANEKEYIKFNEIEFDVLIHCAAVIPKNFDGENSQKAAQINKDIDKNVMKLCEEKSIRMIYMSSFSIYGLNHQEWKKESSLVTPIGSYTEEKYNFERDLLNSDIPNPIILRISSPYGRGQKHQTVLKTFIEKALNNEDIIYHGSGTREQDFINADDIAFAVEKIVENPKVDGIFNIASGSSLSMKEVAEIIVKTVGSNSKIIPSNQQDQQEGYKVKIDITNAKEILGWEPLISIREGIDCLIKHLREKL